MSRSTPRLPDSITTPSGSSPPRRASPSGYWRGASRPSSVGFRWRTRSRRGRKFTTRPSTIRTPATTPRPSPTSDRPKSLDEIDPELLKTYEKLGIPLQEQEMLAGVAVDGGVRQRLGRDHVQGQTRRDGHHLLLDLGCGEGASGPGAALPRLRGALFGQLLRDPELSGCSPTAPSSTCRRACAARWSFPPTSASTPPTPASSSARSSSPTRAPT